jgi:hypothetical protein
MIKHGTEPVVSQDWINWYLQVICVNRVLGTNRSIERGELTSRGTWCEAPFEYKVIQGFGAPAIPTRYKDPFDAVRVCYVQG